MKCVAVVSGGMDSATMLYDLYKNISQDIYVLSFDYGQRHVRELESAKKLSEDLNLSWDLVDLKSVTPLLKGSSLTDSSIEVPHGHYAEESMKATVVPNRNAMMLAIAYGYAVSLKADRVCTAVHSGDHFIYPDCRPDFIQAVELAFKLGNESNIEVFTPFINISKTAIAKLGWDLGVPFEDTWTCYEGGEVHCGQCGACVERKEAFRDNNLPDPTIYSA